MNTTHVSYLQLQEVLKVVTIGVQLLLVTANYCLSNVDQCVHLYTFFWQPQNFFILFFLRVQLQKPFQSEVFKAAGSRDHLLPCHIFLPELPAGSALSLLHWEGLGLPPAVQDSLGQSKGYGHRKKIP